MTEDSRPNDDGDDMSALRTRNQQLEASLKDVRETADRRIIAAELRAEAVKSGMVDLDGLKLVEPDEVRIDDTGQVRGAASVVARLRKDKPWLFPQANSSSSASVPASSSSRTKLATEMTLDEWRAARAELLRRR